METYDRWRFNILRDDAYIRKVVAVCVLGAAGLWVVLGYDSGVVMVEKLVTTGSWAAASAYYGRSLHFSAYVIYGELFLAASLHLRKAGIAKTKNVLYSVMFVLLNVALFELVYMALFNHYQLGRGLLPWLAGDFMFLCNYFLLLQFGVYGVLLIASEKPRYRFNASSFATLLLTAFFFGVWIYYPLQTVQASYGDWVSSSLFPQTHYAYVHTSIYVEDNILHTVNLACKSLFALTQLLFLRGIGKAEPAA